MKNRFHTVLLAGLAIVLLSVSACTAPPTEHTESMDRPGQESITFAQNVDPKKALSLIPFLKEAPLLLFVNADLCAECQALKPVLAKVRKGFPNISVLDLNLNHKPQCPVGLKHYDGIMTAYAPVVTPTLIFIAKGGAVSTILAGNQKETYLQEAFQKIQLPVEQSPKVKTDPNTLLSCDS